MIKRMLNKGKQLVRNFVCAVRDYLLHQKSIVAQEISFDPLQINQHSNTRYHTHRGYRLTERAHQLCCQYLNLCGEQLVYCISLLSPKKHEQILKLSSLYYIFTLPYGLGTMSRLTAILPNLIYLGILSLGVPPTIFTRLSIGIIRPEISFIAPQLEPKINRDYTAIATYNVAALPPVLSMNNGLLPARFRQAWLSDKLLNNPSNILPTIICLQECFTENTTRFLVNYLSSRGYPYAVYHIFPGAALGRQWIDYSVWGCSSGLALFSKLPIHYVVALRFQTSVWRYGEEGFCNKGAILCLLRDCDRYILMVNLHLQSKHGPHYTHKRRLELAAILNKISLLKKYCLDNHLNLSETVIAGDFNISLKAEATYGGGDGDEKEIMNELLVNYQQAASPKGSWTIPSNFSHKPCGHRCVEPQINYDKILCAKDNNTLHIQEDWVVQDEEEAVSDHAMKIARLN